MGYAAEVACHETDKQARDVNAFTKHKVDSQKENLVWGPRFSTLRNGGCAAAIYAVAEVTTTTTLVHRGIFSRLRSSGGTRCSEARPIKRRRRRTGARLRMRFSAPLFRRFASTLN